MLASPVQATVRPRISPRCSSKVSTSESTWQGCERLVSPLMTGTVAKAASSISCVMVERADHDGIDIAREHARGVGDGLAAAELHVLAGQHDAFAAELAHGDVEGHPGAGRGPVEDHGQRGAGERADAGGAAALFLHRPAGVRGSCADRRPVCRSDRGNAAGAACSSGRPCACFGAFCARRARCRRDRSAAMASAISASLTISGGRSRTTLSPAATVSSFSARSASTISPLGMAARRPIRQPLPAHLGDHRRMPVFEFRRAAA